MSHGPVPQTPCWGGRGRPAVANGLLKHPSYPKRTNQCENWSIARLCVPPLRKPGGRVGTWAAPVRLGRTGWDRTLVSVEYGHCRVDASLASDENRGDLCALALFQLWSSVISLLARHLQKEAQSQHNNSEFTEDQKKTIAKIATCLELRSAALQSTQSQDEFKLEDLKKLEPILKNILTYNKEFPFDVQPVPLRKILAPGEEEHLEFEEDDEEGGAGAGSPDSFPARVPGTLLPRLPSEPGMTLLTINIEKIGLKDAGQCIDPYITVSVKDLNGIDLTPVQDTPVAVRKEDMYVHFNVDIEIQKHIERLTKGAAIFFEFKHYKPKKRFTSTKCFAFMEMDEIKPGAIVIELYKKPTDFKRKKLQLLTKKPLYLHLHQTLHKE
ncbi:PREDICTED: axin interactor, dorsalization-associated protein [Nestor notabilis]|nr:PREDICTED: axin interactor, dorsalization-associated protein [Nestor notabilis]